LGAFMDVVGPLATMAACPSARTAFQLGGGFRVLLGIGEPGNFMAASKGPEFGIGTHPRNVRFLNGVANSGAAVGAVIAAPADRVALPVCGGWRSAFVVSGAAGARFWLMVWAVAVSSSRNIIR